MEIDTLRLLIEVARQSSFAAVARLRDVDASSVSRSIAQLESELGVRLFHRSTRAMRLTEAGERYVHRVEALVQELDAAAEDADAVSAQPNALLRVTASVAFGQCCLVPLLPMLRKQYPDLRLELFLTDSNLDLVAERIDLAIRLGPSVSGDFVAAKLFDTQYRVCASPRWIKSTATLRKPTDLSNVSCLLFALPEFRTLWSFRDAKGHVTKVPVSGNVTISNALALRSAAVAGLGPTLLADWLIQDELATGRLVDVFPAHRVTATTFDTAAFLLYPHRAFLPTKVRVAIDFLRQHLRPPSIAATKKRRANAD